MSDTVYLAHHGIKGMKWGVRKYQNDDGSLTPAGEKRYQKNERKAEVNSSREIMYRAKAAKYRAKSEVFAQRRDKAKARWIQTDFSIAKAERFDRKRARQAVKARKYEAKADRAARRADKWLSQNERLLENAPKAVSDSTKARVDALIDRSS